MIVSVAQTVVLLYFMLIENLVQSSNIIRLSEARWAVFELRHTDRAHSYAHFKQIEVEDLQECIAECTATDGCKSINFEYFNETTQEEPEFPQCQLVKYDWNVNPSYNLSIGWNHYDTGISRYTRFTKISANQCIKPFNGQSYQCDHSGWGTYSSEWMKKRGLDGINNAWYEYNPVTGIVRHICTGKFLYFTSLTINNPMKWAAIALTYSPQTRFRRNFRDLVTFERLCLLSPDGNIHTTLVFCHSYADSEMKFQFSDLERGPVKVSVYDGVTDIESDANWAADNPTSFGYQDDMHIIIHYKDNVSYKVQALFVPPVTGDYTFFITCDFECTLHLGETEKESSKKQIATGTTAGASGLFLFEHRQSSSLLYLEEGERYYIQADLTDHTGDEYMTIGYRIPDENNIRALERDVLIPLP